MPSELVTLSDGSKRNVCPVPFTQYIRVMQRIQGVLTKQRFPFTDGRDLIRKAVERLIPDMVEHCGVETVKLCAADKALVQEVAIRVNELDRLFDKASIGVVALNSKAMLMTIESAGVLDPVPPAA
jgi:hypothetical protein